MKACKKCHLLVKKGTRCPVCKEKSLSTNYSGTIIIFDTESKIAKELGAKTKGDHAIRVK